jgi:hypothetical protein
MKKAMGADGFQNFFSLKGRSSTALHAFYFS